MKDRAWFEQRLKDIRASLAQLRANLHATEGAEQFCLEILKQDEESAPPPEGSA